MTVPPVDLTHIETSELEAMVAAGHEILECLRVLRKTGDNVVGEVLRHQGTFYEWDHYPKGDVYDHETHAQYYYHAHPQTERTGEHGHFHTFLRANGMPAGLKPARLKDFVAPEKPNDVLSHLVAISMDRQGVPIRLFTTNRWVTAETWFKAADVKAMLPSFAIDHAKPSWPTNRWITAMLRLFRPQIEALLVERDRTIARWRKSRRPENVYEDRDLEITSSLEISVEDQLRAVQMDLSTRE